MAWNIAPANIIDIIAATVTLVAALVNLMRRQIPGIRTLAYVMLAIALWSVFSAMEGMTSNLEAKVLLLNLQYATSRLFSFLFLLFIIDYYQLCPWLTVFRRWQLALALGGLTLIAFTNPWHHLFWKNYTLGNAGQGVIFENGPFSVIATLSLLAIMFYSYYLLINRVIHLSGPARSKALWVLIAALLPMGAFALYLLPPFMTLGVNLFPITFSLTGLLVTYITFQDISNQLFERARDLEASIEKLNAEIAERKTLEKELREAQDWLSDKLAEQSRKLTGLYDLLVVTGSQHAGDLLDISLKKVKATLECDAIIFYQRNQEQLALKTCYGLTGQGRSTLGQITLPPDLCDQYDYVLVLNENNTNQIPLGRSASGYLACAMKNIEIGQHEFGVIAYFWQDTHLFRIDEIALIGAMTDLVGVVMENDRLRRAASEAAKMQERRRLARDLHDSVTQSLHSLVYSAETAQQIYQTQPEKLPGILKHLITSASQALKEMRLMLFELRLLPIQNVNIEDALTLRMDAVERRAGIEAELLIDPPIQWPQEWQGELYPITIEALNNALRHGRGGKVKVHFSQPNGQFCLSIQDNGQGFTPELVGEAGMGLKNMAERAARLGGKLNIATEPGKGTTIQLIIAREKAN